MNDENQYSPGGGEANDNDGCDREDASIKTTLSPQGPVADAATASTPPSDAKLKRRAHKKRNASKGRRKKLWSRAAGSPPGITSRAEWLELMKLSDTARTDEDPGVDGCVIDRCPLGPLPGPTVCLATQPLPDFGRLENWQTTEGSDHRDILINLLFGGGQNDDGSRKYATQQKRKKRKLTTDSTQENDNCERKPSSLSPLNVPPLPPWSIISNMAGVGGVAVIEIEVIGGEKGTTNPLMPSRRIVDSVNAKCDNVWISLLRQKKTLICGNRDDGKKVTRTIGAACRVKLFHENNKQPRCLSDALMFLPPPPTEFDKANQVNDLDIARAMDDLLLKSKQMRTEGFPVESRSPLSLTSRPASDNTLTAMSAREQICKVSRGSLSSIDVHNSLELVTALSTNVVLNCIEEDAIKNGDDFTKFEHWVKSFSHHIVNEDDLNGHLKRSRQRKIFALDCEMVKTSSPSPELARVSVVMFTGWNDKRENHTNLPCGEEERSIVVLDELVKPRRKVLDYITGNYLSRSVCYTKLYKKDVSRAHDSLSREEYSGITPEMLQHVDTRIEDIQIRLLAMIDEQDIIVGHSLENDLQALRLVHDKVIDTSVIFRGMNGRKFSLKHLTSVLLHKKIQNGSAGHCSSEDAQAALVLALRRARHGYSFRLKESSKRESIIGVFQNMNRAAKKGTDASTFVGRNDGACVCIGNNDWITKYAQSAEGAHHILLCDSILSTMSMAVPSWLSSTLSTKRAGLLWANLRCENQSANGNDHWKSQIKKLDELVVSRT
jgi:hypothetical protein